MTETRLPPQAMSLRARVEQLPRYYECSYDGMKPAPSGEWVKLADVLALLPPETAETEHPCPHMRSSWQHCPHCLGLSSLSAEAQRVLDANRWELYESSSAALCPHGHDLTRVICPHGCR
jgi:hypothetical protein